MERVKIDAQSAAIGGVAGLAVGGVLGYMVSSHVVRRRIEDEIVSVKDHYDNRLARLQAQVTDLEKRNGQANRRLTEDAGYGMSYGFGDAEDPHRAAALPGSDDGDVEGLPALGLEGLDDGEGNEYGDPEPGESGPEADEVPEISGNSGGHIHPGGVRYDFSKPYVIDRDAFAERLEGWQALTLTYFSGDQVLVDDKDQPIQDVFMTTGPLDAIGFGGVSGDPHIRYVRNHRLECDFEIILNEGEYTDIILNYGSSNRNGPN